MAWNLSREHDRNLGYNETPSKTCFNNFEIWFRTANEITLIVNTGLRDRKKTGAFARTLSDDRIDSESILLAQQRGYMMNTIRRKVNLHGE